MSSEFYAFMSSGAVTMICDKTTSTHLLLPHPCPLRDWSQVAEYHVSYQKTPRHACCVCLDGNCHKNLYVQLAHDASAELISYDVWFRESGHSAVPMLRAIWYDFATLINFRQLLLLVSGLYNVCCYWVTGNWQSHLFGHLLRRTQTLRGVGCVMI